MTGADRVRLARAFGIEPMSRWLAGALGIGMAVFFLPAGVAGLVPSGLVLGLYAAERRKIAAGLREVEAWGFPVEGYRQWLLADEPAFDLELRAEVGRELVEQALAAVDPGVATERRGPRFVRVVTPRVRLRLENAAEVIVGDRTLLAAIHARVLAPLHADVGIVALRMGDRIALGALVAPPARGPEREAGFRDAAVAAPPALQALVHAGTADARPGRQTRALALRDDRVLHAAGKQPTSAGIAGMTAIAGAIAGGALAGAAAGWLGGALGLLGGLYAVVRIDRQRAREVALLDSVGYAVEGYDDWLISGRPVIDIEVRDPILAGPATREWIEREVARDARQVTWVGDAIVRIETRPRLVQPSGTAIAPFWGGDPAVAQRIFTSLLPQLQQRAGIVAVRMGGFVDRRE
jgi:hypothetical protein